MSKWKLYWVASDGAEDCFVVAKNSLSARRIEKDMNGFEDDDITVTRIMDVPDKYEKIANKKFREWSKKQNVNTHLDIDTLTAWPYYAPEWLLKKLGIEYRVIDKKREILINDTVISGENIYTVGIKALKELSDNKYIEAANVSYEGLRKAIEYMLGDCMVTIHRIESYITESFIFAVGNEKYFDYTLEEVIKLLKDKFTFGKLIQLMEERYEIDEVVHNGLRLFLTQRNKIAHGLTKDPRYDIDTLWGQKELVAYLAIFLKNAWALEAVFEAAYITTMGVAGHLLKDNLNDPKELKFINDFEKDPDVIEKVSLFAEVFKFKE